MHHIAHLVDRPGGIGLHQGFTACETRRGPTLPAADLRPMTLVRPALKPFDIW